MITHRHQGLKHRPFEEQTYQNMLVLNCSVNQLHKNDKHQGLTNSAVDDRAAARRAHIQFDNDNSHNNNDNNDTIIL